MPNSASNKAFVTRVYHSRATPPASSAATSSSSNANRNTSRKCTASMPSNPSTESFKRLPRRTAKSWCPASQGTRRRDDATRRKVTFPSKGRSATREKIWLAMPWYGDCAGYLLGCGGAAVPASARPCVTSWKNASVLHSDSW
eukprot:scaffold442_cov268-Pinguiococcus_pyrenoidosus.AAC.27